MKKSSGNMQVMLIIVNDQNKPFSQVKPNSPKMFNAMLELTKKYEEMFKTTFKVKRCIFDKKGKVKLI